MTGIKRYIGMASWYRKLIKNFSELIVPLLNIIKGKKTKQTVEWTELAKNSFENIKQRPISTLVLRNPDFSKPFSI